MKKSITAIDKLILLCKSVQQTSAIYCEALGLKVTLQSPELVELRDVNNFRIYLKAIKKPYQLPKGYSPIISFKVENFDQTYESLVRCKLMADGGIIKTERGKMGSFVGPEGEHLSINDLEEETGDEETGEKEEDKSMGQILNILNKIKR